MPLERIRLGMWITSLGVVSLPSHLLRSHHSPQAVGILGTRRSHLASFRIQRMSRYNDSAMSDVSPVPALAKRLEEIIMGLPIAGLGKLQPLFAERFTAILASHEEIWATRASYICRTQLGGSKA